MPKVDMDMERGTIAAWHVAPGAKVEKDAPLFDIETDKAAMEVESPAEGYLHHILAAEGAEVAIGSPVAWIYAEGEPVGNPPQAPADATEKSAGESALPIENGWTHAETPAQDAPGRFRATPAARRLAAIQGIDLSAVAGSGPRGRVQKRDVEALGETRTSTPSKLTLAPTPETAPAAAPPLLPRLAEDSLVLIHGFGADAASWTGFRRHLPRAVGTTAIELPGHGRTESVEISDFADLARWVCAKFDALGIQNAHLVGHSLGGALALAIADARPRAVSALTLLSPAGLGPHIDASVVGGIAAASRPESLAPWLKMLVADPDAISWSYVQSAAAGRKDPATRTAQQRLAEALFPDGVQAFDLAPALQRVACPTRIVWGRQDKIIPWQHALSAPGHVALHLFPHLGHLPHVEDPASIATLFAAPANHSAGQQPAR